MEVISTSLEEVKILEYQFNTDNRGLSYQYYCKSELKKEETHFNYIGTYILFCEGRYTLWDTFSNLQLYANISP